MKTIEEKARAYDEALAKAVEIHRNYKGRVRAVDVVIEEVFPELKESEDERIRKWLIGYFNQYIIDGMPQVFGNGLNVKDVIAWLEKQDIYYTFEIKSGHWYKCVCDYMPNGSDLIFKNGRLYYCRSDWRLGSEIDERNVKDIGVHGYKSFFRPATNQEIKDWLEKKGEQHPKFRIGDIIKKKSTGDIVTISEIDLKNREYRLSNTGFIPFKYEHLWELVEQKPMNEKYLYKAGYLDGFEDRVRDTVIKEDEQKSTWSEEDDKILKSIIINIENLQFSEDMQEKHHHIPNANKSYYQIKIDWLKSLKDRVQPKQQWSEEECTNKH